MALQFIGQSDDWIKSLHEEVKRASIIKEAFAGWIRENPDSPYRSFAEDMIQDQQATITWFTFAMNHLKEHGYKQ